MFQIETKVILGKLKSCHKRAEVENISTHCGCDICGGIQGKIT